MATRQYIGQRIIPVFAPDVEWDIDNTYDALTMVQHEGETFMSRQFVPAGIQLPDSSQGEQYNNYWVHMSNWNAQVESYRQEVLAYNSRISGVENALPVADFSETTVKDAIDSLETKMANNLISFDTVSDMQNYDYLFVGAVCKTEGFYTVNDGGAAYYIISDSGTPNGMDIIDCDDFVATMIIQNGVVNVDQLGAVSDGTTDNSNIITRALSLCNHVEFSTAKTYACNNQINISNKYVNGNFAKLVFENSIGANAIVSTTNFCKLENINIDKVPNGYALKLTYPANQGVFENIRITEVSNGIFIARAWYTKISNVFVYCTNKADGKCFHFGPETVGDYTANDAVNGISFNQVSASGGAYGLYIDCAFEGNTFTGLTCERNEIYGIYSTNHAAGTFKLNDVYFEGTANGTAQYPLINLEASPSLMCEVSNALIRTQHAFSVSDKAWSNNIVVVGNIYNVNGINTFTSRYYGTHYNVENGIQSPVMNRSIGSKLYGVRKYKSANITSVSYTLKTRNNAYGQEMRINVLMGLTFFTSRSGDSYNKSAFKTMTHIYNTGGGLYAKTYPIWVVPAYGNPEDLGMPKTIAVTATVADVGNDHVYTITITGGSDFNGEDMTIVADFETPGSTWIRTVE